MVRERGKITMRLLNSDYKAFEEQLRIMAKKGWMLEKLGMFIAYYKSIEPKEINFNVDIFPDGDRWKHENNYEVVNYRHNCEEKGWHYIASKEYIQCFYAEEGEKTEPIHTDMSEEGKIIKKVICKNNLIISLWILVIILNLFVSLNISNSYRALLSYIGVWGRYVSPVVILTCLCVCIYNIIKHIKISKYIKKEISIPRPSYKWARIRAVFLKVGVLILFASFLLSILIDCYYIGISILLIILGFILIMVIIVYSNKVLKELDVRESVKIIVLGVLITILFFIFFVVNIIILGFSMTNKSNDLNKVPNDYRILRIQNLDSEKCDDTMEFSFHRRRSPIIPKSYICFERTRSKSIWVEYYKAISREFAKDVYDERIKKVSYSEPSSKVNKKQWDADEVYLFNDGTSVILLRDKEVIYVGGYSDMEVQDKVEVIKKLYNQ